MIMQLQTQTQDSLVCREPQTGNVDWESDESKNMGNRDFLFRKQVTLVVETLDVVGLQPSSSPSIVLFGCLFSDLFMYT